jgi:hypothetical protein
MRIRKILEQKMELEEIPQEEVRNIWYTLRLKIQMINTLGLTRQDMEREVETQYREYDAMIHDMIRHQTLMIEEIDKAHHQILEICRELMSPRSEDMVVEFNPRNEGFQELEKKFLDKERGIREILNDIEHIDEITREDEDLERSTEILQM